MRLLIGLLFVLGAPQALADEAPMLEPFTTDGCSWSPDGTPVNPKKYQGCCKLHDAEYWVGGTEDQRLQADLAFKQCLLDKGATRFRAGLYFRTVRQMARPRGCDFCWGYGWDPRPRKYAPLTREQEAQVPEMTEEEILATPVTKDFFLE